MISVDLKGANEALDTLIGLIIPWRRRNAERKAKLENAQRQAEVQRLNAETLIARAKAERELAAAELDRRQQELVIAQAKKTEAEGILLTVQATKLKAEAEREVSLLRRSQIELATEIIDRFAPNISDIEKVDYIANRLLPVVQRLTDSTIEPVVIYPNYNKLTE